jgi:dihydroorotase
VILSEFGPNPAISQKGGLAVRSRFPYIMALLFFPPTLAAQQHFDTVLKGGRVIDPRNATDAVMDVGIMDQRIAAIQKNIVPWSADEVIDVTGLIVAPGLVDIHSHVYAGTGLRGAYDGDNSVYPDGFTFRSCVTLRRRIWPRNIRR